MPITLASKVLLLIHGRAFKGLFRYSRKPRGKSLIPKIGSQNLKGHSRFPNRSCKRRKLSQWFEIYEKIETSGFNCLFSHRPGPSLIMLHFYWAKTPTLTSPPPRLGRGGGCVRPLKSSELLVWDFSSPCAFSYPLYPTVSQPLWL